MPEKGENKEKAYGKYSLANKLFPFHEVGLRGGVRMGVVIEEEKPFLV